MAKNRGTIIGSIIGGAIVATAVILLIRKLSKPKKYDLKSLAKFITNPTELASGDDPDSWKEMNPELLQKLEKLSALYGSKLRVTSGYRSPAHNASVGGASNSAHLRGYAVDIYTGSYENNIKLGRLAKTLGFKRFGVGSTFIHLDIDPNLTQNAVWTYNGISDPRATQDLNLT
jgi:uncharacterized protein YcbK (DUF882 family)